MNNKLSMENKILRKMTLVALISLLIFFMFSYWKVSKTVFEEEVKENEIKVKYISETLEKKTNEIEILMEGIRGNIETAKLNEDNFDEIIDIIMSNEKMIYRIELISENGIVEKTYPYLEERIGVSLENSELINDLSYTNWKYSNLKIDPKTGKTNIIMTIKMEKGDILAGYIDAERIGAQLPATIVDRGEELSVIDSRGYYIYNSNKEAFKKGFVDEKYSEKLKLNLEMRNANYYKNKNELLSYSNVYGLKWMTYIKSDLNYLRSEFLKRWLKFVLYFSIVVVISVVVIYIVLKKSFEPIEELKTEIKKIYDGESESIDKEYEIQEFNQIKNFVNKFLMDLDEEKREFEAKVSMRTKVLNESMEELKSTQEKLIANEKMASLGGLVAGMAHVLNTPIGVCITAISYLKESNASIDEKIKVNKIKKSELTAYIQDNTEGMSIIQRNLESASALVENFKKIYVEEKTMEKREINIKNIIEGVISKYYIEIGEKDISVMIDCDEELSIYGYSSLFIQIFLHLVGNSIDHGFEERIGGTISISVYKSEKNLKIDYRDNGNGIQEEIYPKIFEPFFTTRRGMGNQGLGLYIIYNIITQALEGKIECRNEESGVSFEITIPYK